MFRIFCCSLLTLLGTTACTVERSGSGPMPAPEQIRETISRLGVQPTDHLIVVDVRKQQLALIHQDQIKEIYTISTSKRGVGQKIDTWKTPRGLHRINEKIGHHMPPYGIFHRRKFVGVWNTQPRHRHFKDYVSTRILRLEGLQPGLNKGRDYLGHIVDSETRAIYIHGTTMEWKLGKPSTKGCIHMSAADVIRLFDRVPPGTLVWIH